MTFDSSTFRYGLLIPKKKQFAVRGSLKRSPALSSVFGDDSDEEVERSAIVIGT